MGQEAQSIWMLCRRARRRGGAAREQIWGDEIEDGGDLPEEEIGVRHEVGDALEHTPGLEHERRERNPVEVHADSTLA